MACLLRVCPALFTMLVCSGIGFAQDARVSTPADGSPAGIDPAKLARFEQYALTHQGDPERGREIFLDEKQAKCSVCHKVDGQGGDAGPDLSKIGGKFDRPHLIEALLEPSRQIVEGYRSSALVLNSGEVETGIVKEESEDTLTLVDVEGHKKQISKADVAERVQSDVSLMPVGVGNAITKDQLTDLVAYLETLWGGMKPAMGSGVAGAYQLPEQFEIETVATGLTGGTALEVLPDGRVFVCEQTGSLRVVEDDQLLEEPFVTLEVDSYWERGVIGVTVDPDFPETPHVYICYVALKPYPHHRVSRFTADGNVAVPGSEKILLKGDNQLKFGGNVPAGHQGGALHFGPDRKLYISIGENTAGMPAQRLNTFQGKILRINPDGSIPRDNPFYRRAKGKYRAIWARGCRNPFTFAFDLERRLMLINDVGGKYEEINPGVAGANYGWPVVNHGPVPDRRKYVGPIHIYPEASIAGGDFCKPESGWPEKYHDKYLFADFVHGWIKTIDPNNHDDVQVFARGIRRPTDFRFAPDGSLYLLLRNAWVIDRRFEPGTGTLMKLRYTGGADVAGD